MYDYSSEGSPSPYSGAAIVIWVERQIFSMPIICITLHSGAVYISIFIGYKYTRTIYVRQVEPARTEMK